MNNSTNFKNAKTFKPKIPSKNKLIQVFRG